MEKGMKTAFLIIDMQRGFIDPSSSLCMKTAADIVPACAKAMDAARRAGIPVFHVRREYRADGSDVEFTRKARWKAGGRPLAPGSDTAQPPEELREKAGEYVIIKPRWSAFFGTELDLILRRLGVGRVIITGTTTPNCIRATCYDAIALDYGAVLLEDCCSAVTGEIQRVNMADMRNIGAEIVSSAEWEKSLED